MTANTKKKIKWIGLSFLLLAASASVIKFFSPQHEELIKPKVTFVIDAIYELGIVYAEEEYKLRYGMNTTILSLYVSEGDTVKKGRLC